MNTKISRLTAALMAILIALPLFAMPNPAAPRELTSLTANARGKGTLKVGKEVFNVYSVVVKLKEDGAGEIIVVTEITLFLNCSWTAGADLSKGVDLKLTSGANVGPQGSGKLLLRPDGQSIASLTMQGISNISKRKVQLDFVAD